MEAREALGTEVVRVDSKLFYRGGAPEALSAGGAAVALAAAGFSLRQLAAVRRRLKKWDAVCSHWLAPSGLAVAAAAAATRRKIPFLAIAHSGDVHLLKRLRLAGTASRLLARAGAKLAFSSGPLAARFLDQCGASRDLLAARSLVSPMGIEIESARAPTSPSRRLRILFLGRLVPIKGVDILLAAFAALGETKTAELMICGEGPERSALEARARELGIDSAVRFMGEVRGPARDHILANADVLVVPSRELDDGRTEGMPVVVLEAIASGTPVIVSATGGMTELPDSVPKVLAGDAAALTSTLRGFSDPLVRSRALERQAPIATAQQWDRVGTILWRHWTDVGGIGRPSLASGS